jgi:hypothetical protein
MPVHEDNGDRGSESRQRTQRRFLLNLSLFIGLVFIGLLRFVSDADDAPAAVEPRPIAASTLSLTDLAYLNGQMLALTENPNAMPRYEVEWVLQSSRKEIGRYTAFIGKDEAELEALAQHFFKGYTERFNDYFDTSPARHFGYRYGLRYNPEIHSMIDQKMIFKLLRLHEDRIKQEFAVQDEAEWRLFLLAFDQGFRAGYGQSEAGVTTDSFRDKSTPFED